MKHLIWLFLAVSTAAFAADPIKIIKIETLTGADNAALSFDGKIETAWFAGWSTPVARAKITFDKTYKISGIKYFDGSGQPRLNLYADENAATPLKSIALSQYWLWLTEDLDIEANSLIIEISTIQGDKAVPEIMFLGKPTGAAPPPVPPTPTSTVIKGIGARFGVSSFHWVDPALSAGVFTMKRDFQMASWTLTPQGFSPQPLAGGISDNVLGYDDYLADAKAKGVLIVPCINQVPPWFVGIQQNAERSFVSDYDGMSVPIYNTKAGIAEYFEQENEIGAQERSSGFDPDMMPRRPGSDPLSPSSYVEWAKFFFQWCARYGTTVWPDNMLKVNELPPYPNYPHNEKKSGLGLIQYIEPGNEFVKFWKPELGITPEQVAALLSAVYDGHCGTLGPGVGIKGCGVKLVLPGMTSANKEEYMRMEKWCRENRPDGKVAWDIANCHWYSNVGNIPGVWPPKSWTAGTPADCDPGWSDVEAFVKYVHSTGMEVWCTEFGYDSRPPSWQEAKPYGNYSSEGLQALWLARTYLMMFRAGMDRAFAFNNINEPGAVNGGLYQNCGLLYGRGEPIPYAAKPAYYAVAELAKNLEGYDYIGDASPGGRVMLMRFKKGNQTVAYVWHASVDGSTAQIKIDGKIITVTETPQFIRMKAGRVISSKSPLIKKWFQPKTVPKLIKKHTFVRPIRGSW